VASAAAGAAGFACCAACVAGAVVGAAGGVELRPQAVMLIRLKAIATGSRIIVPSFSRYQRMPCT
jgi:hypothetical protein